MKLFKKTLNTLFWVPLIASAVSASTVAMAAPSADDVSTEFKKAKSEATKTVTDYGRSKKPTNCVTVAKAGETFPEIDALPKSWLGKKFYKSIVEKKTLICKIPIINIPNGKLIAYYDRTLNTIGLSSRDGGLTISSAFHEAKHGGEDNSIITKNNSLSAGYQFYIATEVGAYSLSFIDAYQRNEIRSSEKLRKYKYATMNDYITVKTLESILDKNPSYKEKLQDPTQKPPAEIVDALMSECLEDPNFLKGYHTDFRKIMTPFLERGDKFTFETLKSDELKEVLSNGLYTAKELPKTIEKFKEIASKIKSGKQLQSYLTPESSQWGKHLTPTSTNPNIRNAEAVSKSRQEASKPKGEAAHTAGGRYNNG